MTHENFVFYNPVKILFGKAQIANIIAETSVDNAV
ncbi:iron-containing alcohol dehydrogenase [Nostoc sp. C057]|nr:iron-containing alcohol dehydrogenase [Nostoc sp. C057]